MPDRKDYTMEVKIQVNKLFRYFQNKLNDLNNIFNK